MGKDNVISLGLMLSLVGFAAWYVGLFNFPIKEQVNHLADEVVKKTADYKRQVNNLSESKNSTPRLSSSAAPHAQQFARQTSDEVAGCNDESVKQLLMNNTFGKFRTIALEQWELLEAKANSETFQKAPPFMCPPFVAPYTGPEPPSGYVSGRGYRDPSNAPYNPKTGAPLTTSDYLESHNRACAAQAASLQEQERLREAKFNESRARLTRNIELLKNVDFVIVNVRHQNYDRTNNIRYCAAEFKYENLSIELRQALGDEVSLPSGKDPSCGKAFTYKIESLLDKPESFFVSWTCLPVNRDLQ